MEVKTVLGRLLVLLFAALSGARAVVHVKYFKDGDLMVLQPRVSGTIKNILWKHNGSLLAEGLPDGLSYYRSFKGRSSLDFKTGHLEITKMGEADAGSYTLEINNIVHDESYTAKAIEEVPEPSVVIQPLACTSESANCTVLCEGRAPGAPTEDTSKAEPISYSWSRDGGEWRPSGKMFEIDKDTSHTLTFACRMQNPVSEKDSAPEKNPFYKTPTTPDPPSKSHTGGIVGGVVLVLIVAALGGLMFWKRDAIRAWFNQIRANDHPDANGSPKADPVTVPLSGSTTEHPA